MKRKKFLLVIITICTLSTIAFLNSSKKTGNNVITQNVEALAGEEIKPPYHCLGEGCLECPLTILKVEYIMSGWNLNE